jgi:hypothetical protein
LQRETKHKPQIITGAKMTVIITIIEKITMKGCMNWFNSEENGIIDSDLHSSLQQIKPHFKTGLYIHNVRKGLVKRTN